LVPNVLRKKVAVWDCQTNHYLDAPPFNPPERYPEYRFSECDPANTTYAAFRDLLAALDLDPNNFGKETWNPFGNIIKPGMNVLIKPNWVCQSHEQGKDVFSIIVHSSLLRAVIDYVLIALDDNGTILIGDAPLFNTDFDELIRIAQVNALLSWYRERSRLNFHLVDFRKEKRVRGRFGLSKTVRNCGDPSGYTVVDLGARSLLNEISSRYKDFRVAVSDYREMARHHNSENHEYVLPDSVLKADVIFNISKLKTHRRTGATLSLKNFIGISGLKSCLPHYCAGSFEEGGDEYLHKNIRKRALSKLSDLIPMIDSSLGRAPIYVMMKAIRASSKLKAFTDEFYEGQWYGNDTLWRTILDLNRIVQYCDKYGKLTDRHQRSVFSVVDGIIGGQGNGPLAPDPIKCGYLIAGFNPILVDIVSSTLMGFDYRLIPLIQKSLLTKALNVDENEAEQVRIVSNLEGVSNLSDLTNATPFHFVPNKGWLGHV
jgi:uncharacterized protein (DUF362 family)